MATRGDSMQRPRDAARPRVTLSPRQALRSRRRIAAALLGLALGVMLGLLYTARSRWLVSAQLALALPVRPAVWLDTTTLYGQEPAPRIERALRSAAAARPDDAEVQVALATRSIYLGNNAKVDALRRFAPLISRFPNTPAVYAAALRLSAPSVVRLSGSASSRPDDLAEFDHLAARAERLDPTNAFFPMMRSAGLFAAGRERDALSALSRAAARPDWREYMGDEARGSFRLSDAAFGAGNPVGRAGLVWAVEIEHYPLLMHSAEAAVRRADAEERAGHAARSYAIRHAVMIVGGRMRAQSTSLLGSTAGCAIQQAALRVPLNAPARTATLEMRAYASFLRRAGHPGEAAWAAKQATACADVTRIAGVGLGRFDLAERFGAFSMWFAFGHILLQGALWTALFGLFAAGLERRTQHILHPARRQRSDRIGFVVLWVVAIALAGAALLLPSPAETLGPLPYNLRTVPALGLSAPLVVMAVLALAAARKSSDRAVLRRELPAMALPVACLLVLLYGGASLQTLRCGATIDRGLEAMVQHEGRFYADLAGVPWPD